MVQALVASVRGFEERVVVLAGGCEERVLVPAALVASVVSRPFSGRPQVPGIQQEHKELGGVCFLFTENFFLARYVLELEELLCFSAW